MRDVLKEDIARRERRAAAAQNGAAKGVRVPARAVGESLDDDLPDQSSQRVVVWRWHMRRRRK